MPETLTWAEFDDFWKAWNETKTLADLIPWITAHADKMEKTRPEIVREIIIAMSQQYDMHLEKASSVDLLSEHQACINDAQGLLDLLNLFIDENIPLIYQESFLTVEVFEKFFEIFCKWGHFTGNKADQKLRATEKVVIDKWIIKINNIGLSPDYILRLKKSWGQSFGRQKKEIEELKDQVLVILTPVEDDITQEILRKEGGVRDLFSYDAGPGVKDRLLNVKSNLWNPNNNSPALRILATAYKDPVVQVNALELLQLLKDTSNTGTWELKADQVKAFYKNHEPITAIWQAAIATPLQFRCLYSARDLRKHLISMGIGEASLPLPNWLLAGMEDNETKQTSKQDIAAE